MAGRPESISQNLLPTNEAVDSALKVGLVFLWAIDPCIEGAAVAQCLGSVADGTTGFAVDDIAE